LTSNFRSIILNNNIKWGLPLPKKNW
jgi:hypothetical protein